MGYFAVNGQAAGISVFRIRGTDNETMISGGEQRRAEVGGGYDLR